MRDFQTKSNVGALPDSNSATKYGGGEATSLRTEAKNAVSHAGLTLAPQDGTAEDTTQLPQAMMINGMSASTFQAGGTANAITLTPVTGATGLLLPPDYTTLDGAQFSFFAGFTNTAATTASIGQTVGTQFGVKKILDEAGVDLTGGEIVDGSRTDLVYDASADGGSGAYILRPVAAGATALPRLLVQDQRTNGTNGGTATTGAWTAQRQINTVLENTIPGASLAANQIVLPAGEYIVRGSSQFFNTGQCKTRLYNVTDAATAISGTSSAASGAAGSSTAPVVGKLSLVAAKTFRVDYYALATGGTSDLGLATSSGEVEVYLDLDIQKVG